MPKRQISIQENYFFNLFLVGLIRIVICYCVKDRLEMRPVAVLKFAQKMSLIFAK